MVGMQTDDQTWWLSWAWSTNHHGSTSMICSMKCNTWITKNINSCGCKEKSYRWLMKAISAVVSVLWCESAEGRRLLRLIRVTDRVGFTYLNLYAISFSFLKPRGHELPLFAGCGWICGLGLREVKCVFWSCVNKAMRRADVAAAFVQIHT